MPRRGENIWKRKDGRWEARFIKYRDTMGKAHYASVYAGSYRDVKKKRADALSNIALYPQRDLRPAVLQTLKSFSLEYLQVHKPEIKESSFSRYNDLLTWYVFPKLGEKTLSDLRKEDFESLSSELSQRGGKSGSGLSSKTVRDTITLLRQIIKYADQRGLLMASSFFLEAPRQTGSPIVVLSPSDQKTLEDYIASNCTPVSFGIMISLYTGLRIGELCGLMWKDLNLEDRILTVSRTVIRIDNPEDLRSGKTKLIIDKPKTVMSERKIPIHSNLLPGLAKLILRCANPGSCYFLSESGKPTEPRNYYEKYKRILRICGLQGYTFHALRHTFATRCIENGVDPKTLSEILGHSNVQITLNRYVHPSLDAKRQAVERLSFYNSGQIKWSAAESARDFPDFQMQS